MPTAINETLGGNVRKFMRVAAGSLIGAVVFWLIAMFSDASARREAEGHGRHYSSDKPSRRVWVGIGSILGAVFMIFSPLLGVVRRHPRLAAMFGLTTLFGVNWVFWDAVDQVEHKVFDGRGGPSAANRFRPRDWQFSGLLPASADDVLGIGPSRGRRCRDPLSDGAYFDAVGAAAERRMAEEYRRTGRLPGDFSS